MMIDEQRWAEVKKSLPVGTTVHGQVHAIAPFGVFVKLVESDVVALLLVTHFEDGSRAFAIEEYPQVGESVEAVVVDLAEHNHQVRLSTRSSDLAMARQRTGAGLES